MATPQRLTSQVSTDAAPMTPRSFVGESMHFPDLSVDAIAGRRAPGHNQQIQSPAIMVQQRPSIAGNNQQQQIQSPAMVQQKQSNAGQERPANLQLQHDKLTSTLGDLEKLEMNARERIKGLTLTNDEDEDSSYSSMGSVSISSIPSMPSIGWQEELKKYEDQMPVTIKTDYFDALILYAENKEDRIAAEKFRMHLIEEIDIGKNGPVTAMLYDCPELTALSGSQIGHLSEAVERSTYVFMYLTEHFVKDKWMEFSSESCLMTAIYDDDKRWCVVPVYTQRRAKCSFKIPMGLNSLKGINYYNNDEFYRRGVARLINDKVPQRKDKNEQLKMRKKTWLEEHKRKQFELQQMQKRVGLVEEQKTLAKIQLLKDETEKFIQNGMIAGFHQSHSESQLSASYQSLPHISRAESYKDIHSQNPAVAAIFQQFNMHNKQAQWAYTQEQIQAIQNAATQPSVQTPYGQPHYYIPVQEHDADRYGNVRCSTSVTGDYDATVHFPLQTHQGIENVAIPKSLSDKIVSFSDGQKQEFVKLFIKENEMHNPPDVSHYQQIQTKEQLLQPNSQQIPGHLSLGQSQSNPGQAGVVLAETMHASVQQHGGPLSNAPPLSTSRHDCVYQSNMGQAQVMPGSPWTNQGYSGNQHNMVPVQGSPGNQPFSTHMHGDYGNQLNQNSMQGISPQNQPHLSALLSHNSSNQSLGRFNSGENSIQQEGNLPVSALLSSLEIDCGSLRSNTASANTTARAPTADQGKPLQSTKEGKHMDDEEKDREVTKEKKLTSSKTEKHVHYTINVYNANAVQVGNQNMAQSSTGVEPNSDDASDDERESFPLNVIGTGRREQETMEPSHRTQVLKKDPAEGDSDDQGTRAETEDQQQPIQGSCNMDAALSSTGSQPVINYQVELPFQHGTKQKTIVEEDHSEASDDEVTKNNLTSSKHPETTNQLPEGMDKLLCGEGNLEASTSVEKSSLRDKVIIEKVTFKETNEIEKNAVGDLKRQDSRFKTENNPAVAIISPMRPKIPSESGEGTELKEVVQSDQTNVKSVVTESNESRAINYLGTQAQSAQLLRKSAEDCDRDQYLSNIDNTVYSPVDGASANVSHEVPVTRDNREPFSTHRITNARALFFPPRVSPVPSGIDALSSSSTQGGPSAGFIPAAEPFCGTTTGDRDIEYDMCDSDGFEGTVSTSGERSTSRPRGKPKTKGLQANKQCAIS